jgi:beta-lactamase regulating signal transducer with metallopeptidase domain
MKHTTKLGPNRYIRLDSYGESNETRRFNFFCALFVIAITVMTAGAMVGVDITNLNPQNNENTHRPGR